MYVIQRVIFNRVTSWPQLLSKFLIVPIPVSNAASDWPSSHFFTPKMFLFSILIQFPSCTILHVVLIAVAQLSINGTNVTSVTDRTNEPQYHVKEDEGSITLCIRVESFLEEKDTLIINYSTAEGTACKSICCYVRF